MSFRKRLDNCHLSEKIMENLMFFAVALCALAVGIPFAVIGGQISAFVGIAGFIVGAAIGLCLSKPACIILSLLGFGIAYGVAWMLDQCIPSNSEALALDVDPEMAMAAVTTYDAVDTNTDSAAVNALAVSSPGVISGQYGVPTTPVNTSAGTGLVNSSLYPKLDGFADTKFEFKI